jgi:polar amino acid transport system substrate-binding protein
MDTQSLIDTLKKFSSNRKIWIIGGAIAALFLLLIVRSCSSESEGESSFTIGEDSQWRTANVMGKQRELAAFSKELLTTLGKTEKIDFKMAFIPQAELLSSLEDEDVMGVLTDLQPDKFQEQHLLFSKPFILLGPVLIIPSGELKKWNEKGHKIIGVEHDQATSLNMDNNPSVEMRLYRDEHKALSDLNAGNIDAAVVSAFPAFVYIQTFYPNELKIVTPPLTEEGLRLVTLKNEKGRQLIDAYNEGLDRLKETGTYDKLLEKWGLVNPEKFGQK